MVGAVLVQNTAWSNAEKAIGALSDAGLLSPHGLRSADVADIAQLIYSSGYYNMKARKLKALVEWLGERDDDIEALMADDPAALREELLGIHGIGEETADDILLYALDMPVFVIDHYTKRLLFRLGLAPEKGPYTLYHQLFTETPPSRRPALQRVPRPDRHPRRECLQEGTHLCRMLPAADLSDGHVSGVGFSDQYHLVVTQYSPRYSPSAVSAMNPPLPTFYAILSTFFSRVSHRRNNEI